jgi:hypothetical protein
MAYNYDQLNRLFYDNSASVLPHVPRGVHKDRPYPDSRIMAGIALAESSGDPIADNGIAVGLWQVNWSAWKGDPYIRSLTGGSRERLKDPTVNAKAACYIYYVGTRKGYAENNGYASWDTYNGGQFKKFVPDTVNTLPVPLGVAEGVAGGAGAVASKLPDVAGAIANATNGVLNTFKNVAVTGGALAIGLVLIILGVILLNHDNIKSATKTVAGVIR